MDFPANVPGDHPEMSTSSPPQSMSGPEPKALRRSLRKLDAFLLVPVTVIYFLNFLDRYVYLHFLLHASTFLGMPPIGGRECLGWPG
jgi:hypothetical protein